MQDEKERDSEGRRFLVTAGYPAETSGVGVMIEKAVKYLDPKKDGVPCVLFVVTKGGPKGDTYRLRLSDGSVIAAEPNTDKAKKHIPTCFPDGHRTAATVYGITHKSDAAKATDAFAADLEAKAKDAEETLLTNLQTAKVIPLIGMTPLHQVAARSLKGKGKVKFAFDPNDDVEVHLIEVATS